MVTQHVTRSFGFLKTTAIGGVFFLLPLIVIAALVGQGVQIVWAIAVPLAGALPEQIRNLFGYTMLFAAALALIVLACFVSGILARRSIAKKMTTIVEKYLLMLFPRYAIFKEQLSGNIGGDIFKNRLSPVLVSLQDCQRVAFEVERTADDRVVVYLPGSPDPWSGSVVLVRSDQVESLPADFGLTLGAFEKLGQETKLLLS